MQILLSGRILHDCAARTAAAPSNSNREIGWTELQGTRPLSRRPQHFEALASIPVKVAERVANYKCANKTRDLSCTASVRNGSKADNLKVSDGGLHSVPLNHGVATMKRSACFGEANGPTSLPPCRSLNVVSSTQLLSSR